MDQLELFQNPPFESGFDALRQDLAQLYFNAINDMLALQKSKSILMTKRGVHDVLSGRLDQLVKQREERMLQFLTEQTDQNQ